MKLITIATLLLLIVFVYAIFSPLLVARALVYDTLSASNYVSSTMESSTGNYIINYVYEIEVKKPELSVDRSGVRQGDSITINGANFANSTVSVQAFDEKLLIFNENDGNSDDKLNQTVGLLLASSDIALVQSAMGKDASMKKFTYDNNSEQINNGTATLVIKIPSSRGTQNYSANLQCKSTPNFSMPDGDSTMIPFGSGIVNGSSRQFMNTSLPAGNYQNCEIMVALSNTEAGNIFRSEPLNFTVVPDKYAKSDAEGADGKAVVVASNGSFQLRVSVDDSIQPGMYVFMAEEQLKNEDVNRAIVPVQVLAKQHESTTHTRVASIQESSVESSIQSSSKSTLSSTTSIDVSSNQHGPNEDNNNGSNDDGNSGGQEEQQPPTTPPPDEGPKELCTTDNSAIEFSNDASYTNTLSQTSIQTANNAIVNDDTITITQRIIGVPGANTSQHIITSVDVKSDNEATQSIRQNIIQEAEIEHCHVVGDNESNDGIGSSGSGRATNATNFALSAALQEAYNIYSDSDVIQIQQTIIIPKYCYANVYAPITIDDKNRIAQSIDQDIVQKSKVKFVTDGSTSDQGSVVDNAGYYSYLQKNYVTQLSIQGASNTAVDNNVININQAIILPASCDADVHAPIVIKSSSDIKLSVTQKAEQVSTIKLVGQQSGSAPAITIANAISTGNNSQASTDNGGSIFTNTIFNYADQYGENLFIDNDSLEVVQQIFYVNDTAGWTLDNYQNKLATEFGGNDDNSTSLTAINNQTSDAPLQPANDTGGNNNNTAFAEETETADGIPSNDTSTDNGTSTAITSNITNVVQQSGLQDAFNYNQDNSTINVSQDSEGYQIDTSASVHDANNVEQTNGQAQAQGAAVASDSNQIPKGNATSTNSIEQTGIQVATNYNEENSDTTVDQEALGNQVNAGIEVTDENSLAQDDEQNQSQEAIITTGGNSTGA